MIKPAISLGLLLLWSTFASAAPCVPGTLQSYINLGATGCEAGVIQFTNFELAPGLSVATPLDPNAVQITPGGNATMSTLTVGVNVSVVAPNIVESFFRFNVVGNALTDGFAQLNSPAATGDGAVIGILDVCAGDFLGVAPIGCSGTAATAITFATATDQMLMDAVHFAPTSFFDVFFDITVDPGLTGTASLESATVGFVVPEPRTVLLVPGALLAIVLLRSRNILSFRRKENTCDAPTRQLL